MKKPLLTLLLAAIAAISHALEVNQADARQLQQIKGIGPVLAQNIIEQRDIKHFLDWDDFIERTKGVGKKKALNMAAGGLTVNGQTLPSPDYYQENSAEFTHRQKAAKTRK